MFLWSTSLAWLSFRFLFSFFESARGEHSFFLICFFRGLIAYTSHCFTSIAEWTPLTRSRPGRGSPSAPTPHGPQRADAGRRWPASAQTGRKLALVTCLVTCLSRTNAPPSSSRVGTATRQHPGEQLSQETGAIRTAARCSSTPACHRRSARKSHRAGPRPPLASDKRPDAQSFVALVTGRTCQRSGETIYSASVHVERDRAGARNFHSPRRRPHRSRASRSPTANPVPSPADLLCLLAPRLRDRVVRGEFMDLSELLPTSLSLSHTPTRTVRHNTAPTRRARLEHRATCCDDTTSCAAHDLRLLSAHGGRLDCVPVHHSSAPP